MTLTRMTSLLAIAILATASTTVSAENDGRFYAGAYYFDWTVKFSIPDEFSVLGENARFDDSGTRLVGGYMLNDYVGFELHAASGGTGKEFEGLMEAELEHVIGVFARFNMPLYRHWGNVFALVGAAKGEVEFSSPVVSGGDSVDESGLALGGGLEVAIMPERLYLSADYMQYIKETSNSGLDNTEGTAVSMGLRYLF